MDKEEMQKKIREEEDYIRCPKCSNSLTKFVARNPDGVEDSTISRLLLISEEDIQELYEEAIEILRADMGRDEEEDAS